MGAVHVGGLPEGVQPLPGGARRSNPHFLTSSGHVEAATRRGAKTRAQTGSPVIFRYSRAASVLEVLPIPIDTKRAQRGWARIWDIISF